MAELQFEYDIVLGSAYTNTCIGNEPNNKLVQYYIQNLKQGNSETQIAYSDYNNLVWQKTLALMTSQAVRKIGIKNFPQIGAIGFCSLKYENRSFIIAPIFVNERKYIAPTIVLQQLTETIRVIFSNPDDITYECFRIVFREDTYAAEYVSYDLVLEVPKPPTGTYQVAVMGYVEERMISDIRYYPDVAVENPNPTPHPLGDTVYSVNTQTADIHGNVALPAEDVPFAADGFEATDVKSAIQEVGTSIAFTVTLDKDSWMSNTQTVSAFQVTGAPTEILLTAPVPDSHSAWAQYGVFAYSAAAEHMTFKCATVPLVNIVVQVVIA